MKASAWLVITCVLAGGCVHDALLSTTPGVGEFPGGPSEVAPESPLGHEIESGYEAYDVALAPLGQWSTDPVYGVRWCPKITGPTPFVPYASNGHWAPVESLPMPHASLPPDAPYWVADPDVARGDITLHHGWWVGDNRPGARGHWCWIPGVEEVAARVVWRESEGYVAWAPEPPPTGDESEDDDELLSWVYEFTGTLFEDGLDDYLLRGDDANIADAVTHWARSRERGSGRPPSRVGPSKSTVATARTALSEYIVAHPTVGAPGRPSGSAPSVSSPRLAPGSARFPRASEMFRQMSHDPTLVEGVTAHPLPAVSSEGVRASWAGAGGRDGSFNGYAGHAGAGQGCSCASNSARASRGGESRAIPSQSSESHGSSSHNSYAGHAGGSGGDCGSHSSPHK
jgi:hypothetical protein